MENSDVCEMIHCLFGMSQHILTFLLVQDVQCCQCCTAHSCSVVQVLSLMLIGIITITPHIIIAVPTHPDHCLLLLKKGTPSKEGSKIILRRNKQKQNWIILFTGFEDRGLMLRGVFLDVLPPSVCSILRSDPSGTLQLRKGERSRTPMLPMLSSVILLKFLISN